MKLPWQRVSADAKEAGPYRIWRCQHSKRYICFLGKTTKASMTQVIGGADTPEEAMAICEAHADKAAMAA